MSPVVWNHTIHHRCLSSFKATPKCKYGGAEKLTPNPYLKDRVQKPKDVQTVVKNTRRKRQGSSDRRT